MKFRQTPSQTVGPYFSYGMTPEQYHYPWNSIASGDMVMASVEGQRIRVEGTIFDGQDKPVDDALVEVWQANSHGRYNHPADDRQDNLLESDFKGFGRVGTRDGGCFVFNTVKPGAVGDGQAPHLNLIVFMRGVLLHCYTRLYFADETDANAKDPVLLQIPTERRDTLIARRDNQPGGVVYRMDIHMQGDRETVFFDV